MIDIIIPAYNCARTLFRTLSSLEAQSDMNFNVIVVDDCSTEDITQIIDEKHSRLNIKYVRKQCNGGCGMARQTGIDNSNAEYFTFVDSDDVLMPYAVETFNNMIVTNNYDIYHSYFYEQTSINHLPAIALHKDGFTWCHGKLYKRSFIEKYGIKNSPNVKYADDSYFNSMCLSLGSFCIIPVSMYLWMNNENSITRHGNGAFRKDALSDFIYAMNQSIRFVSKYQKLSEINYVKQTEINIHNSYNSLYSTLSLEEQRRVDILLHEFNELINSKGDEN